MCWICVFFTLFVHRFPLIVLSETRFCIEQVITIFIIDYDFSVSSLSVNEIALFPVHTAPLLPIKGKPTALPPLGGGPGHSLPHGSSRRREHRCSGFDPLGQLTNPAKAASTGAAFC